MLNQKTKRADRNGPILSYMEDWKYPTKRIPCLPPSVFGKLHVKLTEIWRTLPALSFVVIFLPLYLYIFSSIIFLFLTIFIS